MRYLSSVIFLLVLSSGCVMINRIPNEELNYYGVYKSSENHQFTLELLPDNAYILNAASVYSRNARGTGSWEEDHTDEIVLKDSLIEYGIDAELLKIASAPTDSFKVKKLFSYSDFAIVYYFLDSDTLYSDMLSQQGAFLSVDSVLVSYRTWDSRFKNVYTKCINTKRKTGTFTINVDKPNLRERYLLNDTLTVLRDRRNRVKGLAFDNGLTLYRVQDK